MSFLDKVLRAGDGKRVKALQGLVPDVNALEASYRALSDEALQAKTGEFRQKLANGADLDDILIDAFATMREAATRVIGQRHFDVQIMGGAALHFGWVAEMKTGEGKTLVSTLPAYLNGLSGRGVHVITVNDYLARFHAEWMGRIHRFMGLEVGLIIPGHRETPAEKRREYDAEQQMLRMGGGFGGKESQAAPIAAYAALVAQNEALREALRAVEKNTRDKGGWVMTEVNLFVSEQLAARKGK